MQRARLFVPLLAGGIAAAALAATAPPPGAGRAVHLSYKTVFDLKVLPVNASPTEGTPPQRLRIRVEPEGGGETEFSLVWPGPDAETVLKLRARQAAPASGADHALELEAELALPGGTTVRADRRIAFDERTTALFEVYRHEDRPLTLVIEAEAVREAVVSRHPAAGTPIRFLLEIQRIEQGRTIPLETNELRTLEGQAVSYSFRLGSSPDAEAARVSLRPLRINGSIVEIEVETDGRLPDGDGLMVLGRRERWVASRGATSTLEFQSGDPPTGYRFLVTPDF